MDESSTDVNTQPVDAQDTTATESSPVETKAPEADPIMEGLSEGKPEVTEPKKETESEAPKPVEEEQPKEPEAEEQKPEEQREGKKDANTRIRELANQNREYRQQIEQMNSQIYRAQTPQELMEEGETEAMAETKSLRQEIEMERFNRQVTELNHGLDSESQKVLQDFPIFDPDSEQYKPEIAERATALYMQASGFQKDPNTGLIVSANMLPYEFYKTIAETYESSATIGKIQGQKATEQMIASVETPSSASPRETKKDPIMEGLMSD